jgi:uncharacterized OsmC-like protein
MYKVDISCKEDSVFNVTSGEAKVTIDMAEKENLGPLPTLLAALGSCMGVFLRRYADNMKLPIKEFSISVEAELEKTPVMSFRKINVAIDLKSAPLDQAKKDGLMRFINNCPVHNTLHGNPEINAVLR